MIANMKSNRKLSPVVAELFLRRRKIKMLLVSTSYTTFKEPKTIRLNATHYSIMKTNKKEL